MQMIQLSAASVEFVTAEINAVHSLCDRALVPRTANGELLSMSQRVNVLETCYRQLIPQVGKIDPTVFH